MPQSQPRAVPRCTLTLSKESKGFVLVYFNSSVPRAAIRLEPALTSAPDPRPRRLAVSPRCGAVALPHRNCPDNAGPRPLHSPPSHNGPVVRQRGLARLCRQLQQRRGHLHHRIVGPAVNVGQQAVVPAAVAAAQRGDVQGVVRLAEILKGDQAPDADGIVVGIDGDVGRLAALEEARGVVAQPIRVVVNVVLFKVDLGIGLGVSRVSDTPGAALKRSRDKAHCPRGWRPIEGSRTK